jgi:hypothetical protein
MLARERLIDPAKPTIAELETLYLTKLMRRDAKVWWRHYFGGGQALEDYDKNQHEVQQEQDQP